MRLDAALEARLAEAARRTGEPVSRIIRSAIQESCDRILQERLDHRLADVIGIICSDGGRARKSGRSFLEVLRKRGRTRRT